LLRDIELRPASLPGSGLLIMVHDVTSERRAEELLRATEAKFRAIVHENPLPLVLADRSGLIFEANAAAEEMLGRTRAELRSKSLQDWFAPESLETRAAALRDLTQRGDLSTNLSVDLVHADGSSIPANLKMATVQDARGSAAATVHFFRPVEQSVPGGSIFTPLDDATGGPPPAPVVPPGKLLMSTDANGRVAQWSEAATQCFGLSHEEAVGRGLHTFFRPSDASGFYADLVPLHEGGGSQTVEWNYFHPEHGRMKSKFVLIPQEPGTLSLALMSENPVVERKNIVIRLAPKPSAEPSASPPPAPFAIERERMLLGETHHRVKNHLQIVTSMLNLQLSTLHHDNARDALRSSQNRVRSIAALHQHLYSLAMGEGGGFAGFASDLISHLRECYDVGEDRVAVELVVPEEEVPEEWLMPLALSLNEMISNAFKHAYADGRGGKMKVELKLADGSGDLTVRDDGAGMPVDFDDHRTSGLGLKIMRVFAGQLGGEVRVTSDPDEGASFHLHFPLLPGAA
jgi:PAS domain S-box-containing protein